MSIDAQSVTENQVLREQNTVLQATVTELTRQLDWFKKQLFGSKSERRLEQNPEQLSLLDFIVATELPTEHLPTQDIPAHTRRLSNAQDKSESGFRFDDTVPVEEIRCQAVSVNGLCADEYEVIDEKVSYRLAQRPGSYVILKYIRPVIKLKKSSEIISAPAPSGVLGHSRADVSFIAGMLVDKFRYHLPLYRQHQRLTQSGIHVNRNWLTKITHQSCALLKPIAEAVLKSIISGRVIAMDETPIKAGRQKKGRMKTGYYWPVYGEKDEIAFVYQPSRASKHVSEVLGEQDDSKVLISDGYTAYRQFTQQTGMVHAQCWAHTRRKFIDAQTIEPEIGNHALDMIAQLYAVEDNIRALQLTGSQKLQAREQSQAIVTSFFSWVDDVLNQPGLMPSNPMTKALAYARERKKALQVFLTDADVPIDTNHLERALRPIPMGRKNWLFCWTEVGAEYVGIIQTLIVSCQLQNINPYDYLVDILQRIDQHPASQVHELTPVEWKNRFAQNPLRSPLHAI